MQIVRLATSVLWISPGITTSELSISNLLQLLKFLLEVIAIGRKKCPYSVCHDKSGGTAIFFTFLILDALMRADDNLYKAA
jgi:hypothetical protein